MFRAFGSQAASAGLVALALLFGCGRKDAQPHVSADTASSEESAAQDTSSSAAPAATPTGNATTAPLTPADIERWTKGMDGELQAVREAGVKLKSARTSDDTLNALMGVQEMAAVEAGAKAAGVDP